jgi:hypothetical protein
VLHITQELEYRASWGDAVFKSDFEFCPSLWII